MLVVGWHGTQREEAFMLWSILTSRWELVAIVICQGYGLAILGGIFLSGRWDLLDKPISELWEDLPDVIIATGVILALIPPLVANALLEYLHLLLT